MKQKWNKQNENDQNEMKSSKQNGWNKTRQDEPKWSKKRQRAKNWQIELILTQLNISKWNEVWWKWKEINWIKTNIMNWKESELKSYELEEIKWPRLNLKKDSLDTKAGQNEIHGINWIVNEQKWRKMKWKWKWKWNRMGETVCWSGGSSDVKITWNKLI